MAESRTYTEDEVAEIFSRAAEARDDEPAFPSALPEPEGLTLEEIQDVGLEVGLPPQRIAEAAAALAARPQELPRKKVLGAPVSVGRVVEMPRGATDREWEILLAEIRETFRARGRVATLGDTREWRNGNLHVFLEPTATGHRLRMGSRKALVSPPLAASLAGFGVGAALLATRGLDAATFGPGGEILIPLAMILGGGTFLFRMTRKLRRWADERETQMEYLGERARALLSGPAQEE